MITLKQFEERGIDISTMTSEQLRQAGYVTPLNELATVITEPGDYVMRDGRRVTIHEIAPTETLSTTAFNAKGSVWRKNEKMGINPEYQIWHISGRNMPVHDSEKDIVGKWNDH